MELLRFATAGSVDDGKSTLIGRLLHDAKSIFEDQLDAVTDASERMGLDAPNNAEFNLLLRIYNGDSAFLKQLSVTPLPQVNLNKP